MQSTYFNKFYKNKRFFSKGKRGIIYISHFKKTKVAIKEKNPKSEAINIIENEAYFLKKLNKHKIGPEFLFSKNEAIVYKFVEGPFFPDFVKKSNNISREQLFVSSSIPFMSRRMFSKYVKKIDGR